LGFIDERPRSGFNNCFVAKDDARKTARAPRRARRTKPRLAPMDDGNAQIGSFPTALEWTSWTLGDGLAFKHTVFEQKAAQKACS
jgi:hypothetical protein